MRAVAEGSSSFAVLDGRADGHVEELEVALVRADGTIHDWQNYCP